jgi:DNA-3-methyladenine glycosylase
LTGDKPGAALRPVLPQSFYARDALVVARELLGKQLVHGEVVLRITEVEAYCSPEDTASHCRMGRTARNAPMWGEPGHAYVYLCYGMHNMLNLVTNQVGEGAAVLIRSCEPVEGLALIAKRRGGQRGPISLTGPGKVGAALALDTSFSNHALYERGGLYLREGDAPAAVVAGPRVGIAYASAKDQRAPWRFAIADNAWVTQRKQLKLVRASTIEPAIKNGSSRPKRS